MGPTVSILIPAYRAERWVVHQVVAAIDQADEVIVGVDGCEATLQALLPLRRALPPRLRVLYTEAHAGMYLVRNTLADRSTGDILFFADADDVMDADAVAHLRLAFDAGAEIVQPKLRQIAINDARLGNEGERASEGVFAIRRAAFDRLGGFYPWQCLADLELQRRTDVIGLVRAETPGAVYSRRNHPDQHTHQIDMSVQKAERVLLTAALAWLDRQRGAAVREKRPFTYAAIARAIIPMREVEFSA